MKRNVAAVFAGVALITWSTLEVLRWPELQRRAQWSDFNVRLALERSNSKLLVSICEVLGVDSGRWQGNPHRVGWWLSVLAALLVATLLASMVRANRRASMIVLLVGLVMALPGAAIAHDLAMVHRSVPLGLPEFEMVQTQRCDEVESSLVIEVSPTETTCGGEVMGGDLETIGVALPDRLLRAREDARRFFRKTGDEDAKWARSSVNIVAEQNAQLPVIALVIRGLSDVGLTHAQIISKRESPGRLWTRPSVHRHGCAVPIEFGDAGVPVTQFASWRALVEAADNAPAPLKLRAE